MSVVVSTFGAGSDSTAMIILEVEAGNSLDLVIFSDTGGERLAIYEHVARFSDWLVARGYPAITTVRVARETLEESCLRKHTLPAIAFGFKTCSQRFKLDPIDKFINNWQPAKDAWARGEKVIKLIGYDADEAHRIKNYDDNKYTVRYPLVERDLGREDAIEIIDRTGLPLPGKSSCFFCPNMKIPEILALPDDLRARVKFMEKNATAATAIVGLGRDWKWTEVFRADESQLKMFPETRGKMPCGCVD